MANDSPKKIKPQLKFKKTEADSGYTGQYETPPCPAHITSNTLLHIREAHQDGVTTSDNTDDLNGAVDAEVNVVNTESQQDMEQSPKPTFKIGLAETEKGEPTECTHVQEEAMFDSDSADEDVGIKPVQEESQFDEEGAKMYLSPSLLKVLIKREEEVKNLKTKTTE